MVFKPTHKNYDKYNECQLTVKKKVKIDKKIIEFVLIRLLTKPKEPK